MGLKDSTGIVKKQRGGHKGQLHRIQGHVAINASEVLVLAFHSLPPNDRTQWQAFNALMPEIYMLRHEGFSFQQIAELIGQCGFKLQTSSVRSYFNELLITRHDECIKRLDEQLLMISEIKRQTQGLELNKIVSQAASIIARHREARQR
jgi:hypothetical protein